MNKNYNKLEIRLTELKKIFSHSLCKKIFQSKILECNENIVELNKKLDSHYKLLSISFKELEKYIIEDMLIKKAENKLDQLNFEKFLWENKLRIINGGRSKIKYDIEQIKKIPIKTILRGHGIEIVGKNFFKIRNEKTASCNFSEEKNLWVDHGTGEGGSVIDLYMKRNNKSFKESIKELNNLV